MTAAARAQALSPEEYLAAEQRADIKHEYFAGTLVAMGGASRTHGLLAGALFALLLPHARRKGCQLFMADMKVRINAGGDSWFYYPDLVLACDRSDREPLYVRRPCLLVEVLSPSTEQVDTREKLLAYRLLPGLREYLILRQDRRAATLHCKDEVSGHWQRQDLAAGDSLTLQCLDATIALDAIYADVPELS